jgi:hypothetical protein
MIQVTTIGAPQQEVFREVTESVVLEGDPAGAQAVRVSVSGGAVVTDLQQEGFATLVLSLPGVAEG